ncbi:MAG: hypothetical protein CSA72_05525 [Rhodobacterales bacterium]|nr:MAG: hypothetical protein CSA72_05525 [Rhodobacterales bacterium]
MTPPNRIAALVCIRNEQSYLEPLIAHLRAQKVDLFVIDNGSTDGSVDIAKAHLGHGVCDIAHLPYQGCFDLTAQLETKREIISGLTHPWVLHQDADEILQHSIMGRTLDDATREADAAGAQAINFNEFVFLPRPDQDVSQGGAYRELTRYYFFEPAPQRLMRLWRRDSGADNVSRGGHKLAGDVTPHATSHVLRHYICLSQEHLNRKYVGRSFSARDLERRWHGNRLNLTETELDLSRIPENWLSHLSQPESMTFDTSRPRKAHFWQPGALDDPA